MYHMEQSGGKWRKPKRPGRDQLVDRCLKAFVEAGTLDLSLDQLARKARSSKRMLVHYFGTRETLEETAMARLEERLRGRFSATAFTEPATPEMVVTLLWDQATSVDSKGLLMLLMYLSRRACKGSDRAKAFYQEQSRLWIELLLRFLPDREKVEDLLQFFQGALLVFLVTGDREAGKRSLLRMLSSFTSETK
jgi:AcrR family transcriptional regulator